MKEKASQMMLDLKEILYFDFVEERDALRRKRTIKK